MNKSCSLFPGTKDQLLAAMLSAYTELIFLYDVAERKLAFASGNLTEILGYPDGTNFTGTAALVHPDDMPGLSLASRQLLAKESAVVICEVRLRHAGGGYQWFLARQVLLSSYIFGVLADIQERKEDEARIKQQAEAIAAFLLASSTVMLQPVSNIRATTAVAEFLPGDVAAYKQWAGLVQEQAVELDRIVRAMVDNIHGSRRAG